MFVWIVWIVFQISHRPTRTDTDMRLRPLVKRFALGWRFTKDRWMMDDRFAGKREDRKYRLSSPWCYQRPCDKLSDLSRFRSCSFSIRPSSFVPRPSSFPLILRASAVNHPSNFTPPTPKAYFTSAQLPALPTTAHSHGAVQHLPGCNPDIRMMSSIAQ